ncbi:MAG TPA: ABC transporter permease [Bacteroidota bacterium]|jgi:lipoprotein-releasing system permease protein|nr:ABC transporter permease [Bacteroidota bacterium]
MAFERYIALRYLLKRKGVRFVNIISTISIVGVTIGVAALIVVLSVYNGFGDLVTSLLMDFDPHLRVESIERADTTAYISILQKIRSLEPQASYSPFIAGKSLIVARNANRVINIKGVDPARLKSVSGLPNKIVLGTSELQMNRNGIIIGMVLADRLGVVVGDTIALISPSGAEMATLQLGLPLIRKYHIVGIYESDNKDYDSYYAFVDFNSAQLLFDAKNKVDGYDIRFGNIHDAEKVKDKLSNDFDKSFRILTWYDLHRELYTVMELERWGAYIVLCLIIAVASFNLLGSLTMTVIQKQRDIGILKAMGSTNKSIEKIFLIQGVLVGIIGTLLGYGIGYLLVVLQQRYHLFPLDPSVYIISAIPVKAKVLDFIVVGIAAIGLCTIAARIPAKRAAQLLPERALRWE